MVISYGYDNNSRLTGITYQFGSNTLGNLTYAYDQLGQRTQVSGSFARTGLPGAVTSATYDAANELTNWNGLALSYDQNGNMLSDGANAFTWNAEIRWRS
jgi:YD repeat-containing protein